MPGMWTASSGKKENTADMEQNKSLQAGTDNSGIWGRQTLQSRN